MQPLDVVHFPAASVIGAVAYGQALRDRGVGRGQSLYA